MSYLLDPAAKLDPQRREDLAREDAALIAGMFPMECNLHPVFQQALAPFAPPPAHSFKRIGGTDLDETVTPTCSCGWKGRPVEGWRDSQSTELAAQEYQHRMEGMTPQQLRDGACL